MKVLLDSHILLWSALDNPKLSRLASEIIEDERNELCYSVVSLWELSIKSSLRRGGFSVNSRRLRAGLLSNGYEELPVSAEHALAVEDLPLIHKDPFDRLLIAQAQVEGALLITADQAMGAYGDVVRLV